MKRLIITLALISLSFLKTFSQETQPLDISGELLCDERFEYSNDNRWVWNENRLTLNFERKNSSFGKFYASLWVRNLGTPDLKNISMLSDKNATDPSLLEIKEAYAEIYGFLFKNLDLKIGKQRIAWGTADKLNPTDNLNPYDLEDILDFGRHKGSFAINLKYYIKDRIELQGVYIPFFKPATLPYEPYNEILFANITENANFTFPGIQSVSISDSLIIPKDNLFKNPTYGFKLKSQLFNIDFSLSYVYSFNELPVPNRNEITINMIERNANIKTFLNYNRNHIVGFDFAGNLMSVGFWGEAALFIPEKDNIMKTYINETYFPNYDSTIIKKEPYIKYILGFDYTFPGNLYINTQFLHGFINEYGKNNLNDYVLMRVEKKLFDNKLTFSPLSGALVISDWSNIKNNWTLVYMPEIKYHATDNAEISLNTVIFDGKGNNIFTSLKNSDLFSIKLKYNF